MYEDAKVAAAQAAAQAESAAAQAASGMSTVMASDPMQLAKTATERAAAAAERLNSGVTTEDLLGMRTPVKAAASTATHDVCFTSFFPVRKLSGPPVIAP